MYNTISDWLRPPIKALLHLITGETEIERVSRRNDLEALDYSLEASTVLVRYRNHHSYMRHFEEEQVDELMAIKNITNRNNCYYVRKLVRELHSWRHTLVYLEAQKNIRYDRNRGDHQKLLLQIWKNLKPNQQLKNRISEQWMEIGFQGNDPATDFRGAGSLGLCNLNSFSAKESCKEIFHVATSKGTQYFFSSASLFMTVTAVELARSKIIPVEFWVLESTTDTVLAKFQSLYEMVFKQFFIFWLNTPDKSLMQFNTNLLKFAANIKQYSATEIREAMLRAIDQHKAVDQNGVVDDQ